MLASGSDARLIPAPSGAFALTASTRFIAVLVGDERAKTVSLIDGAGTVTASFAVSSHSTSLAATSDGRRLFVGRDGGATGGLDEWSLDGTRLHSIHLGASVLSLATSGTGELLVLLHGPKVASVNVFDPSTSRVIDTVAVQAGASSIASCALGIEPSAVVADGAGDDVEVVELSSHQSVRVGSQFVSPICSQRNQALYGIQYGIDSSGLSIAPLDTLLQVRIEPIVGGATRLTPLLGGGVLVLGHSQTGSQIELIGGSSPRLSAKVARSDR